MAKLLEIYRQHGDNAELRNRVTAAVAISASEIFEEENPTQARLTWAKDAVINAEKISGDWMWAILGSEKLTTAIDTASSIESAKPIIEGVKTENISDEDIQLTVNNLRDKYAV